MVSTLSGLNFSLYRERLRRHKHSFFSILTSCCRIFPPCSFLTPTQLSPGSLKPSSVLCHWLLSAVARSHTDTNFKGALTCVPPIPCDQGEKESSDYLYHLQQTELQCCARKLIGSWFFCMAPHKMYLSTALPVGQQLEAIHKTAPP